MREYGSAASPDSGCKALQTDGRYPSCGRGWILHPAPQSYPLTAYDFYGMQWAAAGAFNGIFFLLSALGVPRQNHIAKSPVILMVDKLHFTFLYFSLLAKNQLLFMHIL